MDAEVRVRPAEPADAGQLLDLMRGLARFEGYADRFRVTAADLMERGLAPAGAAEFSAFVAERRRGELLGYAVLLETSFTFDLRPTLTLKELYVRDSARGTGVGGALFGHLVAHGRGRGAGRLAWNVLPTNERARDFYRARGGAPDRAWEPWTLAL